MAVTFVGADAGVSGDYTSLSPTIHASAATGDVMLLWATVRNTAASVVAPTGWTVLASDTNVALYGKYKAASEATPSVTFTGGAVGDTTTAQVAVFRGLYLAANQGPTFQSNGSQQHIPLPAFTPARASSLLIVAGWKQDDWTSVTNLLTEIGEVSSLSGNDSGQVWSYQIQTSIAAGPAGPFNVNGGVAAISKSMEIALNQLPVISVLAQDVWPPRVQISVTDVVVGDTVSIYRVVAGVRTLVQGGSAVATDVSFLRIDATLPFGVPVSYVAVVSGMEVTSSAVTYVLTGGKVAVSDAIGDLSAEVVITAWPAKRRGRSATVFNVDGRNVVVAGSFAQAESDVEVYTEAYSSAESLTTLLENATQGIVQIRQPGGYDGVDGFYAVTAFEVKRFSQDGTDDRRLFALHLAEVDGWAATFQALGFTYADLATAYTGLTYASVAADYATYLLLDQADLS